MNYDNEFFNNLKKKINILSINEQEEIFKILIKHDCNYTKNNNGVFINMNKTFNKDVIEDIEYLLEYSDNNKYIEKDRLEKVNLLKN